MLGLLLKLVGHSVCVCVCLYLGFSVNVAVTIPPPFKIKLSTMFQNQFSSPDEQTTPIF